MGEKTGIQWTDHTFNPVWGCTRVSQGCVHCYAETFANRMGVGWGPRADRRTFGDKHWSEPLKWNRQAVATGKRRKVFCGSMCDIFEDHPITAAQLPRLMQLIYATPMLDWLLLTKRPHRAARYLSAWLAEQDGPESPAGTVKPSWWLGTSIEDQPTADERLVQLFNAPASLYFASYEPALAGVDLGMYLSRRGLMGFDSLPGLEWVIVGGESGAGARPFDLAWAREAIRKCRIARVPVFIKQMGAKPYDGFLSTSELLDYPAPRNGGEPVRRRLVLRDHKGDDMAEWPPDLRIREFPEVRA